MFDRLLHHVHIVYIDRRSHRLRELDGLLRPEAVAPRTRGRKEVTSQKPIRSLRRNRCPHNHGFRE